MSPATQCAECGKQYFTPEAELPVDPAAQSAVLKPLILASLNHLQEKHDITPIQTLIMGLKVFELMAEAKRRQIKIEVANPLIAGKMKFYPETPSTGFEQAEMVKPK